MARIPKTIEVDARFQMLEDTGLLVHEGDVCLELTKEQFDRIKASFDSGKFKHMTDDESLSDLTDQFIKPVKKARWQRFVFEYPVVVTNGKTYEENCKSMYFMTDKELQSFIDAIVDEAIEKDEKISDRLFGEEDEELERLDAIDELNVWMMERGFDEGEVNVGLEDEEGWCIECLDIGWRYGVCPGKGCFKPVAVQFYHTTDEQLELAKEQGFEVFLSIEEFKDYIEKTYLGRR